MGEIEEILQVIGSNWNKHGITSLSIGFSGFTILGVPKNTKRNQNGLVINRGLTSKSEESDPSKQFIICTFKAFVKTTSPLEELIKMWPAIKYPLKGIVVAELKTDQQLQFQSSISFINHRQKRVKNQCFYLESSFAMVASETGFVVNAVIGGQLVDEIDGLFASHTFLGCACKCHFFAVFFTRRMKISSSLWRLQWKKWALFRRMGKRSKGYIDE